MSYIIIVSHKMFSLLEKGKLNIYNISKMGNGMKEVGNHWTKVIVLVYSHVSGEYVFKSCGQQMN